MPPREATNPFPDQYLTLDYEGGPIPMMQHDGGAGGGQQGVAEGTQTTDPTAVGEDFGGGGGVAALPPLGDMTAHNNAAIAAAQDEAAAQVAAAAAQAEEQAEPPSDPLGNEFLPHGAADALTFHGAPIGSFRLNEAAQQQPFPPQHAFAGGVGISTGTTAGAALHSGAQHVAGGAAGLQQPAGVLRRPAPAARNVSVDPLSVDAAMSEATAGGGAGAVGWNGGAPMTPHRGLHAGQQAQASGGAASPHFSNAPNFSGIGVGGNSIVPTSSRPAPSVSPSHSVASVGVYPVSGYPGAFRGESYGGYAGISGDQYSHAAHAAGVSGQSPNAPASYPSHNVPQQQQQHGAARSHSSSNVNVATMNHSNNDAAAASAAMVSPAINNNNNNNGNGNVRAISLTNSIQTSPSAESHNTAEDHHHPHHDDDDMNSHGTAPLSPGSEFAASSTNSPTNSPLSSTVLFTPGSSAGSGSGSGSGSGGTAGATSSTESAASRRSAHRSLLSVLDQSASLDDDDDADDEDKNDKNGNNVSTNEASMPGLDTTNVSDSTEEDCTMEDSEEQHTTANDSNADATNANSAEVTDEDDASTPPPPPPSSADQLSSLPGTNAAAGVVQQSPVAGGGGFVGSPSNQSFISQTSAASIRGSQAFDMGSPGQQVRNQQQQQQQNNLLVSPLTPQQALAQAQAAQQMQQIQQMHYGAHYAAGYPQGSPAAPTMQQQPQPPPASSPIALSFASTTTVSDLKYFAERGLIVPLLAALETPRLKTLGTRMLADYAKMSARRVAVASNRRILEFVSRTMVESPQIASGQIDKDGSIDELSQLGDTGPTWLAREYAVETVRSLTATEESDAYLMGCPDLLQTLACVARGGPFVSVTGAESDAVPGQAVEPKAVGMASPKARLHACIAIMNLSCGKSNKVEIASIPDVLEAMRDVMLGRNFPPPSATRESGRLANVAEEARLKATTCVKNLSNADANDGSLLGTPGLVEALGVVAEATCSEDRGATTCTTNACLALMNLSISKANKHRVFRTRGVMDALMAVISRTVPPEEEGAATGANPEARVKACSALSNLAIGYDNKIPMFNYPGFVDSILGVIETDNGEARTKACSILWSFAAEMKNQVPVVQRGDILPTLVRVADEDGTTEARFKCVAALTLLAESLANAIPLLESGALAPLMDILHEAGPDPTQWKGQTASWCVGFLMNIAQSDEAVPSLREAGVVELLAPLLTLDHYQSLKAAMAITFVCRYDEGDETYDLLRKTENVIPKIIQLLHNTLSGKGGNGYKYGVFTLRSSVGCISSLASGPDFMKERIATKPVFESLLQVLSDFCVDGGTPGAIVGGGKDDALSATLAVRALQSLTGHLIPIAGSSSLPKEFVNAGMEEKLLIAFESFETCTNANIKDETRRLASDARMRVLGSKSLTTSTAAKAAVNASMKHVSIEDIEDDGGSAVGSIAASIASSCCGGLPALPDMNVECWPSTGAQHATIVEPSQQGLEIIEMDDSSASSSLDGQSAVRTFLLADERTGRRFAVPSDPTGGRAFNDNRVWCYRRGRFCRPGEVPDPNFQWTDELQAAYMAVLARQQRSSSSSLRRSSSNGVVDMTQISSSTI